MISNFEPSNEYIKKRNQVLSPKERQILCSLIWKEIAKQAMNPKKDHGYVKFLENLTKKLK